MHRLKSIDPTTCALVPIDIQAKAIDPYKENQQYIERVYNKVIPNTVKLIEFFRSKDMPVIYVMFDVDILRPDELEVDDDVSPELGPLKDEIRLRKVSTGAFAGSAIDLLLRSKKISTVFFTGVDTSFCVLHTVLGAYDYGYQSVLVEDACAAVGGSAPHELVLNLLSSKPSVLVQTTERVIADYPWQNWVGRD
jgi:nicotinamidase-related amidase